LKSHISFGIFRTFIDQLSLGKVDQEEWLIRVASPDHASEEYGVFK